MQGFAGQALDAPLGVASVGERAFTGRVVITHDFMETYGGAERVTAEMAELFPDAEVHALLARPDVASRMGLDAQRTRSLVPPSEVALRAYRLGAPFWGRYADSVRLPEADVVLASSYGYAHRLRSRNDAPIVCYCHSPLRYVWSMTEDYRERWAPSPMRARAFDAMVAVARRSDERASRRVHKYLTQSPFTADQISRFYGRDAEIIGAPIDCERFRPGSGPTPDGHFLLVSRLVEPYKRVGVAIEAFRRMPDLRLVVAGDGPAMAELRAVAPPNVEFVGQQHDEALVELMQTCRAAVFPSCDDFGLVPVEVMACGRPVLAYAAGGALHTVKAGRTGEFFPTQTPEAIVQAVRDFDPTTYDERVIRVHALAWDRPRFRARLLSAVESAAARQGRFSRPQPVS